MENVEKLAETLNQKNAELVKSIEVKADKSEIETLTKSLESLKEINLKQGEEITKLSKIETEKPKGFDAEIIEVLKSNIDKIKSIKSTKGRLELELKGVSRANVVDNTIGDRLPGVGQKPYRMVVMESLFGTGTTSSQQLYYTDQVNVDRNADNIAECAAYPNTSDIDWIEKSCKIEKIGDTIKVCIEALEDFEFVASEIRNLLMTSVDIKVDSQLLNGNGTSPQIKGLTQIASTFAAGSYALSIQTPNLYDLISVVGCQIAELGQGMYMPNYVLLNPKDACLLKLQKTTNLQ